MMREYENDMSKALSEPRRMPRFLKSMPNAIVAAACRKNSTPPVTSSWLIGAESSTGRITSWCSSTPASAISTMPNSAASEERRAALVGVVDAVHADHHQLGVADPHHVDDAEDQVEPEREQRQQAGEQQPVEDRFEEEDVELTVHQIPIYALRISSLASSSCDEPLALMRPTSSR